MILQKTLNGASTTGYVVDLGGPFSTVKIYNDAAATYWYQTLSTSATTPTAPVATPAPGSGLQASWSGLVPVSSFRQVGGPELPGGAVGGISTFDNIRYVVLWVVAGGMISFEAH